MDQVRVPWLVWRGGPWLKCLRCGAEIPIRLGIPVADLLIYLDTLRVAHRDCPEPPPTNRSRPECRSPG